MGEGLLEVVVGYLLVMVLVEPSVMPVDVAQHTVVDGLQGDVAVGLDGSGRQLFHDGAQRVGSHVALRAGALQLSLQQLAVVGLLPGFGHYLAEYLLSGLRQVFLLGVFHLLPQGAIGLGFHPEGHGNQNGYDNE